MTPEQEQARLQQARAGDRGALGELLAHHGCRVYRALLLPRLGSVTLADEALAASYYEALKAFGQFEDQGLGLYPWFRQIAFRVALKAVRVGARESLWEPADIAREIDDVRAQQPHDVDESLELAQSRTHVARTLSRLTPQHAQTIRLRILEERPREELAAYWGIELNAVDQRVFRAKKSLGAALESGPQIAAPVVVLLVDDGNGEQVHVFARAEVTIGRAPSSALQLDSGGVSRHHAVLRYEEGKVSIEDLDSQNGTLIDGWRVSHSEDLGPGDLIAIGGYHLRVVKDPVTSLWAGAVLAEGALESERVAAGINARRGETTGLPATVPVGEFAPPAHRGNGIEKAVSSGSEDRLELALRAAWGLDQGAAGGPRAQEALERIRCGEREAQGAREWETSG